MATKSLPHGMGTFYKDCEHSQSRWSKCPHEYTLRYRNAAGYTAEWKAGQRDLAESSLRTLESVLEHRILRARVGLRHVPGRHGSAVRTHVLRPQSLTPAHRRARRPSPRQGQRAQRAAASGQVGLQ
ncbi:hypothetical protein ABT234_27420 [Streptomyces sp. NPDC001586]|uniref:hypothetical protein n=1 Tax=Streptomyces sp. NPDC001586 TaxID=3154387 RepID=UPI0033239DDF